MKPIIGKVIEIGNLATLEGRPGLLIETSELALAECGRNILYNLVSVTHEPPPPDESHPSHQTHREKLDLADSEIARLENITRIQAKQIERMSLAKDAEGKRADSAEFALSCEKSKNADHEKDYLAVWKLIKRPDETVVQSIRRVLSEVEQLKADRNAQGVKARNELLSQLTSARNDVREACNQRDAIIAQRNALLVTARVVAHCNRESLPADEIHYAKRIVDSIDAWCLKGNP